MRHEGWVALQHAGQQLHHAQRTPLLLRRRISAAALQQLHQQVQHGLGLHVLH